MKLDTVHHIALIVSDYERSKLFYTDVLGFEILAENYRTDRASFKLDLGVNGKQLLELFSFPNAPARPSFPEACGLRHLAFAVRNLEQIQQELNEKGIATEKIRIDEFTGKRFLFFADPDGLPIELYEIKRDEK